MKQLMKRSSNSKTGENYNKNSSCALGSRERGKVCTSKCSKLMIAKVGNIFGYRLTDSTGRPMVSL